MEEKEKLDTSNIRSRDDLGDFFEKMSGGDNSGIADVLNEIPTVESFMGDEEINYDDEPVVACPVCEDLHLIHTEDGLECFNCGHLVQEKDLLKFDSIFSYLSRNEDSEDTN